MSNLPVQNRSLVIWIALTYYKMEKLYYICTNTHTLVHTQFCVYISEFVIDTTFTRISFPIVDAEMNNKSRIQRSRI